MTIFLAPKLACAAIINELYRYLFAIHLFYVKKRCSDDDKAGVTCIGTWWDKIADGVVDPD